MPCLMDGAIVLCMMYDPRAVCAVGPHQAHSLLLSLLSLLLLCFRRRGGARLRRSRPNNQQPSQSSSSYKDTEAAVWRRGSGFRVW